MLLSAADEKALRVQAERLATRVREEPGIDPVDIGFSLATTRARPTLYCATRIL